MNIKKKLIFPLNDPEVKQNNIDFFEELIGKIEEYQKCKSCKKKIEEINKIKKKYE